MLLNFYPNLNRAVFRIAMSLIFMFLVLGLFAQPCYWSLDLANANYNEEPIEPGDSEISLEYWEVKGQSGPSEYVLQPIPDFHGCPSKIEVYFAFVLYREGKLQPNDRVYVEYRSDLTKEWTTALEMTGTDLISQPKSAIISGEISSLEYKDISSVSVRLGMRAEGLNTAFRIYSDQVCFSTSEAEFCRDFLRQTLPLNLFSFEAKSQESNSAHLEWNTTNEVLVSHFEVERSKNTNKWSKIYAIEANNESSGRYKFVDYNLDEGTYYYRLKIVDEDGSYCYAKVATAKIANRKVVAIYPNPARSVITVNLDELTTPRNFMICDMIGQRVEQGTVTDTQMNLDIDHLSAGYYMLQVFTEGDDGTSVQSQWFVKQ